MSLLTRIDGCRARQESVRKIADLDYRVLRLLECVQGEEEAQDRFWDWAHREIAREDTEMVDLVLNLHNRLSNFCRPGFCNGW